MTSTPLEIFRVYEPHECADSGYPFAWVDISDQGPHDVAEEYLGTGVKDLVRDAAGHRCERCLHPFVVGESGEMADGATHPPESEGGPDLGWAVAAFWFGHEFEDRALDAGEIIRGKRTHWSPCDDRCSHGGPVRWRLHGVSTWVDAAEVELEAIRHQRDRNNVEVEAAWRILTVHHLNGQKHDLRWWNLAALCQRCHLTVQRKVQMERVWPWEHSDWFKPHAAGWYAYSYLGETLTREQVAERQDDLLALELAA